MNQWNTGSGGEQFPPMMFDATQHSTEWGGGGAFLPIENQPEVGWLVSIKGDNGMKPAKSGAGWYREIVLVGMEGPISGQEFVWRWNVLNDNQTTVEITNNQIAALCNVLGVMRFNQPTELVGRPFRLVAEKQKGENPQGWTQLAQKGIRDVNGNIPGRGTGAAAQNPPQPGQVPPNQPQPQPPMQPQPPQPGQPAPPMGPQGQWVPSNAQQPAQAPAAPTWTQGAPAPAVPAPAAPDWQQQPAGNSGAPGWSR